MAAWINADTGVGPSIASGNQICNGNMADFPAPPMKIKAIAQLITEHPMKVVPAAPAKSEESPEVNRSKEKVFV